MQKLPRKLPRAESQLAIVMIVAGAALEAIVANLPAVLPMLGKWGGTATLGFGVALACVNAYRKAQERAAALEGTDEVGT